MRYKREEAFRFDFSEPIKAFFRINELNGKHVDSSEGQAKMIDLSMRGMKIATPLDIRISRENHVGVFIHFTLNGHEYMVQGDIIWKKVHADEYYYGIHFEMDNDMQGTLVADLKAMRKVMSEGS